jgi:hypothetical protein
MAMVRIFEVTYPINLTFIKIAVFLVVTSCLPVDVYRRSSETSSHLYLTIRHHTTDDDIFLNHRGENLKFDLTCAYVVELNVYSYA